LHYASQTKLNALPQQTYCVLNDGTTTLLHAQSLLARAGSHVGLGIGRLGPPTGNLVYKQMLTVRDFKAQQHQSA